MVPETITDTNLVQQHSTTKQGTCRVGYIWRMMCRKLMMSDWGNCHSTTNTIHVHSKQKRQNILGRSGTFAVCVTFSHSKVRILFCSIHRTNCCLCKPSSTTLGTKEKSGSVVGVTALMRTVPGMQLSTPIFSLLLGKSMPYIWLHRWSPLLVGIYYIVPKTSIAWFAYKLC